MGQLQVGHEVNGGAGEYAADKVRGEILDLLEVAKVEQLAGIIGVDKDGDLVIKELGQADGEDAVWNGQQNEADGDGFL